MKGSCEIFVRFMSVLLKFRYEGLLFILFFATYPPWCKHREYR